MCALAAELLAMRIGIVAFVLPGQELGDGVRMPLGGGVEIVVKSLEEKEKEEDGQRC